MIRDLHRIVQLIERDWRDVRVLVVGDVMLDRYIWGTSSECLPRRRCRLCGRIIEASNRGAQPTSR